MDMHSAFVISQTDGRPMYRQILEQIKERVAIGDWPPDFALPSIRELAVALRVSVITVKRAYLELEREGVIVTRHGKGSFVAPDPRLRSGLHQEELDRHLLRSLELARWLGLSTEDLQERLRQLEEESTSETKR